MEMETNNKLNSTAFNDSPNKAPSRLSLKYTATSSQSKIPEKQVSTTTASKCNSSNNYPSKLNLTEFDDLVIYAKPLGLDQNLNKWIDSKKSDPILQASSSVVSIKIINRVYFFVQN